LQFEGKKNYPKISILKSVSVCSSVNFKTFSHPHCKLHAVSNNKKLADDSCGAKGVEECFSR
jgi:hypothetical protein